MLSQGEKRGSTLGAALLISGCCIGAGMLGMPVVTREAGFIPSVLIFLFGWFFMTSSGLILLEVALWFPSETNIAEMTRKYLGKSGEWISFGLMLFLMYALMTAYSSASGTFIHDFSGGKISPSAGTLGFAVILILALIVGTKALDWFNRFFMGGLAAAYLALVYYGFPEIEQSNLLHQNWNMTFVALPIAIVSFGFQNLVPSLVGYLDRDVKKIRTSIILGSIIPLIIYLIWEAIVLGLISQEAVGLDGIQMATTLLKKAAGGEDQVLFFAEAFAFFAITTSFLGNSLSVQDFLSAQMKDSFADFKPLVKRLFISLITVIPALMFAFFNPDIFLQALGAAGGFAATVLFGLIPALICLKGRDRQEGKFWKVPGGKPFLVVLTLFSIIILLFS